MTKLYVVDDDPSFLKLLGEVAPPIGLDIITAADFATFRSTYGGEANAIVMVDMIMPGSDGIELINWLSEQARPAAIILVSGYSEHYTRLAGSLAEAKGLAVVARLAKPIKLGVLRATLADARTAAAAAIPNPAVSRD